MTFKTCPDCGGDEWDNHSNCEQTKRPTLSRALTYKENLHDYDSIPRHQEQEAISRFVRATEKYFSR